MTQVNLQLPNGNVRMAPEDVAIFDITGTGTQTLTVKNEKGIYDVLGVTIRNPSNVRRNPSGAVTFSGQTVTVVDTGFAAGDRVYLRYTYFAQ